jgi:2-polyprenyl-3-methyl-5-hydroxy-6-metoxy-1,4-benzoquinol methylase
MNKILIGMLLLPSVSSICCHAFDYKKWWNDWYSHGGISGSGSRGVLAQFKADVINDYIKTHSIRSVVEFGCGDGYNLALMNYENYLGFDVAKPAINVCSTLFKDDSRKSFMLYDPKCFVNKNLRADLVVCLDVLYHITDEEEFLKVLDDIFSFSSAHVILYTTLYEAGNSPASPEILHRNILPYLQKYPQYEVTIEKQKHQNLSLADFVFLKRK